MLPKKNYNNRNRDSDHEYICNAVSLEDTPTQKRKISVKEEISNLK